MNKQYWIPIAAVFILIAAGASAFADLNAQAIVSAFNNLNPTQPAAQQGYNFTYFAQAGGNSMQVTTGRDRANLTAYTSTFASDGNNYFRSFCVETLESISNGTNYIGKLNLQADGRTKTTESGTYLSLGAAYLYKEFATQLNPLGAGNMNATLITAMQDAIHMTMGLASWNSSNTYIQRLMAQNNSQSYWMQDYYTTREYAEIGSYSVFVMNVTTLSGAAAQDQIYIARASVVPPGVVPEPATMLLWSIGGMGLVGSSWARQRRMKKLAAA